MHYTKRNFYIDQTSLKLVPEGPIDASIIYFSGDLFHWRMYASQRLL